MSIIHTFGLCFHLDWVTASRHLKIFTIRKNVNKTELFVLKEKNFEIKYQVFSFSLTDASII